jgi:steroid delta-isomerase-like uncharacterized protein
MTSEQNKAIVRRFYKAFEDNDMDTLKELLAPDFVAYNPDPQNREVHLQGIRAWHMAFSANQFEILDQIAEGDTVATRVDLHSIHSEAVFQGVPPSGKRINFGGITIERIKDGKIVERLVQTDKLDFMKQLGLIPTAQSAG